MKYDVGKTYEEFIQKSEFSLMKFDGLCAEILLFLKSPDDKTIKAVQTETPFFQIYVKSGIIFLLIKFESIDWHDVSYVQKTPCENLKFPDEERFGYCVNILLIDIMTGKLLAKRHTCFNHGLSKAFYYAIEKQLNHPPKNTKEKINSIRASFHSNEIARLSLGR